jgi:hypothetical protein
MSSARCPSRHSAGHLALPWLLCDCQRAEAAPTSCQPRQRGSVSSQATHGWWGIRYVGLAWLCPRRNTRCRLPAHSCAAGGQAPRSYGPSFEWHVALSDMRLVTPTERARARAPCLEGILDRLWPFCALALEVKGGWRCQEARTEKGNRWVELRWIIQEESLPLPLLRDQIPRCGSGVSASDARQCFPRVRQGFLASA